MRYARAKTLTTTSPPAVRLVHPIGGCPPPPDGALKPDVANNNNNNNTTPPRARPASRTTRRCQVPRGARGIARRRARGRAGNVAKTRGGAVPDGALQHHERRQRMEGKKPALHELCLQHGASFLCACSEPYLSEPSQQPFKFDTPNFFASWAQLLTAP